MIKKAIVFAAAAACLTSGAAFAQSYEYRNDGYQRGVQNDRYDRNGDGRIDREYRRDRNVSAHRDYRDYRDQRSYGDSRDYRRDGYRNDRHYRSGHVYVTPAYGHSSYYQMRRGERLAHQYRGHRYVVSDWHAHRLHRPQHGYHWVQAGNDYALVAIATGIIAQVLLNH